jgi:5-methyltetrahydropteroyltriglutamate--homocysteine methyltransferase
MLAKGPFRADTVGSMLRTKTLKEAREKHDKKQMSDADLTAIEDREIATLAKRLEGIGLTAITDGEFRRSWWHFDFLEHFTGWKRARKK